MLTLNNFVFNPITYLQIMVCAMGTNCAPAYAKISWHNLKSNIYTRKSKTSQYYAYDIWIIYS